MILEGYVGRCAPSSCVRPVCSLAGAEGRGAQDCEALAVAVVVFDENVFFGKIEIFQLFAKESFETRKPAALVRRCRPRLECTTVQTTTTLWAEGEKSAL